MTALIGIGWFLALLLSIALVFESVGSVQLIRMFPEGWRWWHTPYRIFSLLVFAGIVLIHPFR
jgi:hypothetical protein